MSQTTIIRWTFEPQDFREDSWRSSGGEYEFKPRGGKIEIEVPTEALDRDPALVECLHREVDARFVAELLVTHRCYRLAPPSIERMLPGGGRQKPMVPHVVEPEIIMVVGSQVVGKDGLVKPDPLEAARLARINQFTDLFSAVPANDSVGWALIKSYEAAVNEPQNELWRLYEIRDALQAEFRSAASAQNELCIKEADWRRLGKLANDEPLNQGRHRGKTMGHLRDATREELEEARAIAVMMIEAYFRYSKG
jgi:hypothetical protein